MERMGLTIVYKILEMPGSHSILEIGLPISCLSGVAVGTSRFELREKHVWSHHTHWEAIVEHEGEEIGTVLQNTSAVNSKPLGDKKGLESRL